MSRYLARMNAQAIPPELMEAAIVVNDDDGIPDLIQKLPRQGVDRAVGPALQARVSALIRFANGQSVEADGDLVRCASTEPLIELTDGTLTFDPQAFSRCLLSGGG